MNNRVKNAKEVTFKEDFKSKSGKVIYAKDSTHFIHKDLVDKLKSKGAKFTSKDINYEKAVADAKDALEKQEEADKKANR